MKKKVFIILLALAAALPAKVTLSQAVAGAWAISRGLDSQRLEEQAASVAEQTALRRKYFAVHFAGTYRYSSDNVQVKASDFPFDLGPSLPPGTVILAAPSDAIDLKMALVQPLYSGGLLEGAVKMEAARQAAEKHLTRLKKIELAGQVKSSYFNYVLFRSKRDALAFLLSGLELHLKKVENLYAEELVRRSDLLEARGGADEVRLSLQDLEQLIAAEAVLFQSLCGYDPREVEHQPAPAQEPFVAAWERFLSGHPLLLSLEERARLLRLQRKAAAAAYLPQVGAFAEIHYGRPGQNFFLNEWTLYVQGGLSISLPVFHWNQRGRDLELAGMAARKLENRRADFVRESEAHLRQLYLQLESAGKKLALLDGLAANAAEEVRLKEQLYEEKQIDHIHLLAAMCCQERYLSNRGEALAQIDMIRAAIDTLVGRCEEEQ
ncbi:MAG: TolC family protein [Candidatus Aminicenantes bacterium]|nr:TolC family protein [Candidatus Aminicenantes bacterium]